jgi:general secretion pathway protein A
VYAAHFGLTESPFSIAPDPRYLFLSDGHREALAHLLWGLNEGGGGFVLLTGEVGTGKTTLCRALLEQLPPEVDVAMVFNPALTAVELLAAVCDELDVRYPEGTTSLKALVDVLDRYLLDAHARRRRTVLVIDEAQNLSREVLEQIRLLTNLETTREKLLRIVLIGQPELRQLLEREDLRQLAQRVTARYHLSPFTEAETRAYIVHRLQVAGLRRPIFRRGALSALHRSSRGIPRLINTIADRALLGAYASGATLIDAPIVRRAASEVLGRRIFGRWWVPAAAAAGLLAVVGAGAVLATTPPGFRVARSMGTVARAIAPAATTAPASVPVVPPPPAASVPVASLPAALPAAAAPAAGEPVVGPPPEGRRPTLADVLSAPTVDGERAAAFRALYALWRVDYRVRSGDPCEQARQAGLRCVTRAGTWNLVRRLDLPAILALAAPDGEIRHAVLTRLGDETATLQIGGRTVTLAQSEVERAWDGVFVALWRGPSYVMPPLSPGVRGSSVVWLRERLAEATGGPGAGGSEIYDDELRRRVLAFQRAQHLKPDGIAGEETLIRLAALGGDPGVPSLSHERR